MTTTEAATRRDKLPLRRDRLAQACARAWQTLQHWPLPALCGGLFLLSLIIRVGLAAALQLHASPRYTEVERIALSLATTGIFGNPYRVPTGPTAHHAPLYPALLSGLYSLVGAGAGGRLAQIVFNACAASLQYALLPPVAMIGGVSRNVGLLAGLAGALIPVHLLIELNSLESLAGAMLPALFLLTLRMWKSERFSWPSALLLGFGLGLALLLMPSLLPVFAALMLGGGFLAASRAAWSKQALLAAACAALILLPWTARNYVQFGALFFVRNNLGLELSVSNNDLAQASIDDNEKSGAYRQHPFSSSAEAERVKQLGEMAYQREKLQTARNWIKAHPLRFTELTALRTVYFWFPKTARPVQMALLWLLTAAGGVGLWQLFRSHSTMGWGIVLIWASFPLAYYFLQSSPRYRFPIHWSFLLLGAFAVHSVLVHLNVRNRWNLWH